MGKAFYHSAKLLNKEGFESVAAISAKVYSMIGYDDVPSESVDADVNISDCSRVVTLSFTVEDDDELGNATHKISTMINVLMAFNNKLVEAHAIAKANKISNDKKREEEKKNKEARED